MMLVTLILKSAIWIETCGDDLLLPSSWARMAGRERGIRQSSVQGVQTCWMIVCCGLCVFESLFGYRGKNQWRGSRWIWWNESIEVNSMFGCSSSYIDRLMFVKRVYDFIACHCQRITSYPSPLLHRHRRRQWISSLVYLRSFPGVDLRRGWWNGYIILSKWT